VRTLLCIDYLHIRCVALHVELQQKGTKARAKAAERAASIEVMLSRVALLSRRAPAARALSDKVVAAMRLDHGAGGLTLDEADAGDAPLPLFKHWFKKAVRHPEIAEANAMSLATVDPETLQPSCRVVLLKGYDDAGFTWFTNYTSRKASNLENENAKAALTFWWPALERSVRVEGAVEKVAADETAAYFTSRPRASQIGAWVSRQSSSVTVEALVEREKALDARFGDDIPVPDFWGGYRLAPRRVEFWQGRASRLHDRVLFSRGDDGAWTHERQAL
jgi:pyridoxamine 5'-phosphate oxidase